MKTTAIITFLSWRFQLLPISIPPLWKTVSVSECLLLLFLALFSTSMSFLGTEFPESQILIYFTLANNFHGFFLSSNLKYFQSLFVFIFAYAFRKLSTTPFQLLCQAIFDDLIFECQWYFSKCGLFWHFLCLQTLIIVKLFCIFWHFAFDLTVQTHFLKCLCNHKTEN